MANNGTLVVSTPRSRAVDAAHLANEALREAFITGAYLDWCKAADAALKATETCRREGLGRDWVDGYEGKRRDCRARAAKAFADGGRAGTCDGLTFPYPL